MFFFHVLFLREKNSLFLIFSSMEFLTKLERLDFGCNELEELVSQFNAQCNFKVKGGTCRSTGCREVSLCSI